jgi:hypothetical protein
MEKQGSVRLFPRQVEHLKETLKKEPLLPPWLFQYEGLTKALESAQPLKGAALINAINYIHFMDGCVFAHLKHPRFPEGLLIKAVPEPCTGDELTCHWKDGDLSSLKLESHRFQNLIIADGRSIILIPAVPRKMDGEGFTVILPEAGHALCRRDTRRYPCQGVTAELFQSGFFAAGNLVDFSPLSFRIKVNPGPMSSFNWFNTEEQATINLYQGKKIIYSGLCRVVRQTSDHVEREVVLAPMTSQINRFKSKEIRNARHQLVPAPTISFTHPLFKKHVQRETQDISVSGFSVIEKSSEGVLMPGLVIPDMMINYVGILKLKCTAQVLYRREEDEGRVRCGLAILDMDVNDYSHLSHILSHAVDPHTNISKEIDMDALWEFFFDTNFIYPKKYRHFHFHRESFKETYRRLYQESPEIARHFTYEQDGRIYGHISMVRAYERGWLIHHYAARPMESKVTGFLVLKQIMQYLNGVHHLPSAKMDYVMTYYRPNNKIPARVFGGFAGEINDHRKCSVDVFSYLFHTTANPRRHLPKGWDLVKSSNLDLWELDLAYKHRSGGLMIDAFGLGRKDCGKDSLKTVFARLGFARDWTAYSLIHEEKLRAVLVVNRSDLGVNLSELLNCIQVLIVDPEGLPYDILSMAFDQLAAIYQMSEIPVLISPSDYSETQGISCEKQYALWILNMSEGGNSYLEYMQRFRIKLR